ncbi:MAG: hypothetical protein AAGD07_10880 [Planctomycetota bacterium]
MRPKPTHDPGDPKGPCPADLEQIADNLRHPDVIRAGLTCNADGQWALYISVQADTEVPLSDLDAGSFPVVYVAEPAELQRIRSEDGG